MPSKLQSRCIDKVQRRLRRSTLVYYSSYIFYFTNQ